VICEGATEAATNGVATAAAITGIDQAAPTTIVRRRTGRCGLNVFVGASRLDPFDSPSEVERFSVFIN
jgi:hypothetical protein